MGSTSTSPTGTSPSSLSARAPMAPSSPLWTTPPRRKVCLGTAGELASLRFFIISYHLVAIKKLGKIDDMIDAKRVLREIKIMKNLQHENILGLKDVLYHPKEG